MTQEEWLTCTDTGPIPATLQDQFSARKHRLFLVAACRTWESPDELDPLVGAVLDTAERFADNNNDVTLAELHLAKSQLEQCHHEMLKARQYNGFRWVLAAEILTGHSFRIPVFSRAGHLLRDIFGNPFRPVAFDPAWRSEAAIGIARGIYDDRAFERMPILADALQEAGCEHPDILSQCREPGTHVRGCWVVDLVLGKE